MNLARILRLPEVLVDKIEEYISLSTKGMLSKKLFNAFYNNKIQSMELNLYAKYDSYIRGIVRDNRFITYDLLINNAFLIWEKPKPWRWKNLVFPNYLTYIKHLTIKYNRQKLKTIIEEQKKYLSIKKYKKIRSKNISWSN